MLIAWEVFQDGVAFTDPGDSDCLTELDEAGNACKPPRQPGISRKRKVPDEKRASGLYPQRGTLLGIDTEDQRVSATVDRSLNSAAGSPHLPVMPRIASTYPL